MLRVASKNPTIGHNHRSLWTIAAGKVQGRVLSADTHGLIFSHRLTRYKFSQTIAGSDTIWEGSLERTPFPRVEYNNAQRKVGCEASIEYEQHLVGVPWNGDIFFPVYIKSIEVSQNYEN